MSTRAACLTEICGINCSSSRALEPITAASPAMFSFPLTVAATASSSLKSPAGEVAFRPL